MVPLVRYASVSGIPVMELLEKKYGDKAKAEEVMTAMVERTKAAGGEVVKLLGNGSAFYSPASSAVAMAESVLKDRSVCFQRVRALMVSTVLMVTMSEFTAFSVLTVLSRFLN